MKRETTAYERILYYMGNTSLMYFAFRAKVKGVIKKSEDPELYYANRPHQPMDYDFSLSNLGRIQTQKKYGNYEIEKVYGPIFSAIRGERVIGVSTHQGRMFFTCIYDKDCFSYDTGSSIIQKALDMFHDIIKLNYLRVVFTTQSL